MSSSAKATVLVANTYQARKVRWLLWGFFLWFAGFTYWSWDLAHTYGISPGDGGVLRPLATRLTVAGIVFLVGLLPLAGMILYVRRYIAGLVWQGDEVVVSGVGWPSGERRVPLASIEAGRAYDGRFSTYKHSVNAPWLTILIGGRTHIIDLQAEFVDRSAIRRMLDQAQRRKTAAGR